MGAGSSCRKSAGKDAQGNPVEEMAPIEIGKVKDFEHNEIREVKVADGFSVLVSEFEGKMYAYGSKCPHYGAPLVRGALMDGMVRCPWHGACFDIRTGDIEDHPGMECIPVYRTSVDSFGTVSVYPSNPNVYKVHRALGSVTNSSKIMVIIGGGPAALMFAKTLREHYYEGRIVMISKDSHLPYDRPKLSKVPGVSWDDCKLRKEEWFTEANIEVMLNATVTKVDFENKEVIIEDVDAKPIKYDKLLIATGVRPRMPVKSDTNKGIGVQGSDLRNVLTLYNIRDSSRIKTKTAGKDIVIMGTGFIGMELISSLHSHCKSITVLGRSKFPYGVVLGESVGRIIQQRVTDKWKHVTFYGCEEIKEIFGDNEGRVEKILTSKQREIPCEVVIYAIGAVPNTEFLLPSPEDGDLTASIPKYPLNGLPSGYIPVNDFMESSVKDVWVAGDIARIPLKASVSGFASAGHIGLAQKMGRIAALSVMGIKQQPISTTIPFFWTSVAGMNIRYVGYGENYNKSEIFADVESTKFCVVYKRDSKIIALCAGNCDPIASRMAFDLEDGVDFTDRYPEYIVDAFPDPPIIGEVLNEMKYNPLTDYLADYDKYSKFMQRMWNRDKTNLFTPMNYKDIDYRFVHPNMLTNDPNRAYNTRVNDARVIKLLYKNQMQPKILQYRAMKDMVRTMEVPGDEDEEDEPKKTINKVTNKKDDTTPTKKTDKKSK